MIDNLRYSETEFILRKPHRVNRFVGVTLILLSFTVICTYLITDQLRVSVQIALQRAACLILIVFPIWLYDLWNFRRDIEIVINKVDKYAYRINGKMFELIPDESFVVGKYKSNRYGGSLYSIYIAGNEMKIFIAYHLSKDEYDEVAHQLSVFLNLSIKEPSV